MTSPTPIPFSEPPYLSGLPSPYYNDSHRKWQKYCRELVEKHLLQHALEWENEETVPDHVFHTFAAANMLIPNLPSPLPIEWLERLGIHEIGGVAIKEWDYLHTLIYVDEMARSGLAGPPGSLTTGFAFGIPPILKFGSRELQERVCPELLTGKKRCCIAITEPEAGSDVANIHTTATKSPDGRSYLVSGQKKWITNGIWSDYATTAVRTSGPGASGLSLLLIPLKNTPGVTTRRLRVAGQRAAGTTFIEFDDVVVPASNLIGVEGAGMKYVMTNFNHERLLVAIQGARMARVALAAAFEYVMRREAFGKALVEQPVVRHRLAGAGAQLESLWAWLEAFTYQMTRFEKEVADVELGGLTALAKAQTGRVLSECANCAVLLFGGNGFTRSGVGEIAESKWLAFFSAIRCG
ncbi:acyl-CoA dehydrogenase NM domain-like protein [Viridothelium virens]|uniref:Acyl-CoA dehydrogenase NM domain-like protein n=1 Tax=Viridothelium virens TaxID=1048519 RepID=A0A6A6HA66_VIRVR|nr:acyl-CoA dehydrogenase NM domain-like protein [Viridothelium virens]